MINGTFDFSDAVVKLTVSRDRGYGSVNGLGAQTPTQDCPALPLRPPRPGSDEEPDEVSIQDQ
eukprot:4220394-Pyramimonas_sp.AAC.1